MNNEKIKNKINLINVLECPLCHNELVMDDKSLKCINKHTFDFTKKGSIALYKTSGIKENYLYNKELFDSRIKFIKGGFYNELHSLITNIISKYNNKIILDIGSGDGTHDAIILNNIDNSNKMIGIDLSKAGIRSSEIYSSDRFFPILSDLHNLPLKNNSIDIVLNILSPINETEVKRVLKKDGIIIKVTPTKNYLKELRKSLNVDEYKNESIIDDNLNLKYQVIDKINIDNTYDLNEEYLNALYHMTPLSNHKNLDDDIKKITISLNIYVLKIK